MNTVMHRCSSSSTSDAHGYGRPCSCGFFHSQNSPFSVIFSQKSCNNIEGDAHHMYWPPPPPPPPVDCTLSLGTPSTRYISSCDDAEKRRSSCLSNIRCDLFHTTGGAQNLNQSPYMMMSSRGGANHGNANFSGGGGGGGGETMLTRRCANCDTTSTPLWRNGPKGPKSLCNACGIRYKKEERRATAAATATTNTTGGGAIGVDAHHHHTLNTSWVHHHSQNQKPSCITSTYGNEFRFIQDADVDGDSDTATATATAAGAVFPFLSWRLSVTDSRPGLVHNLTM